MPRRKEKPTSELILHSGPPKATCSRAARPDFASQTEQPSTLLFVDVTAPKDKASKRKIRAHIMHATHESRRRRGLEDEKKRQAQNFNAMIQNFRACSPLRLASSGNEDPFDSLPVKSFSGMNDLVLLCTHPVIIQTPSLNHTQTNQQHQQQTWKTTPEPHPSPTVQHPHPAPRPPTPANSPV